MTILFGIPSCDSIRKAKKWLTDHNIEFKFHDFKKQGVPEKALKQWIKQVGWEALLNKRGTTLRQLDDSLKNTVNEKSAIQIMLANPSIIKRPVLDIDGQYNVGFTEQNYSDLF